jgi:glycosyltransferase involved in cell wall biosynthesis
MKKGGPCVSICMPVYNGEMHVREAIQSVFAQTFEDLELIISDNASTDGTQKICLEATTMDPRVQYSRGELNRGLAWNFNRAFELASGRYLVWISHDDVMAPDYISRCVEAIEHDPAAVLCFTNADYIDIRGDLIQRVDMPNPGASAIPSARFKEILLGFCDPICGLMKVEVLRQTRLHGGYADSDRVLLCDMALRGRFCHIPDFLFYRRRHPLRITIQHSNHWDRTLVFDPSIAGKLNCPWVRELLDFIATIRRAPISWTDRLKCSRYLYWWYCAHRKFLQEDVLRGMEWVTKRILMRRTVIRSIVMATLSAMVGAGLSECSSCALRNLL